MKLRIEKEELQKALQNIQGVVDKKTTMPILSHFMLKADKAAFIMATDLEIALKGPITAEIIEKGSLCIPARKLFEIVKEVEGGILLESQENNWLRISAGKSTFKLMGLPEEEYPALPEIGKTEELNIDAGLLRNMIEKTVYATGDSDTRYTLNGLLLHLIPAKKTTELKLVGTDGHRLAIISSKLASPLSSEMKLILPKKGAMELKRILETSSGTITVHLEKNHIFFTIGDIVLTSRLIEGNYPNYDQVIPKDNEKQVIIDKVTCLKALRRTSIMSREKTNAVRFDVEQGKITLISINPDIGEAREEIAAQYKGESISIGYNARYLMDAIQAMDGETIRFEIQEPLSPTLLVEAAGEGAMCVIMPMRV
ncbi:MAG: DNA polymerase III subunit beta [Nitrospirae bacterium]|nr:DNA polymerase III subunit beta [Nitrospirota bacterium]